MAAPSLIVSPSSGKAGTTVTVTGSSFDLYAVEFPQASVYFRGVVVASNVWFSGNGFSTSFQVPVGTPPGTYTVQAIGPRDSAATTFTVVTQPDAGFSMDPTSGMGRAPLTVYFTDTSTGNPASWRWNFGDGSVSPLQNPGHTYPGAGTYTVTLTVTNAAGSSSESRTITVYTPTLVVSPSSGKTGTTVTVTGNSFCLYGIEQGTAALSFDGISPSVNMPMTRNKKPRLFHDHVFRSCRDSTGKLCHPCVRSGGFGDDHVLGHQHRSTRGDRCQTPVRDDSACGSFQRDAILRR